MKSIAFVFSILFFIAEQPARASSCEDLASILLPHITITSAQVIAAGKFAQVSGTPAFCRVTAVSKPTNESDTRIDIWLPISGWNGKLQPGSLGSGIPGGIRYTTVAALEPLPEPVKRAKQAKRPEEAAAIRETLGGSVGAMW